MALWDKNESVQERMTNTFFDDQLEADRILLGLIYTDGHTKIEEFI